MNKLTSDRRDPPVLSIVTGSRNRPDSLRIMINSVLEQTQSPFELLIGDASEKPLNFNDPRVSIFHEYPPVGPVKGFNNLMRKAQGDFVCFLNDDLEVLPGWSEKVTGIFHEHPEIDMACIPLMEPEDPNPFVLLYKQIPYAQMGVVRRIAGDSLGWFDDRFKNYAPDADFTMRLIDSGRKYAPIRGKIVWHYKLEDENRLTMEQNAKSDNGELGRIWKPRRYEILKKFEKNSLQYFSNLNIRYSKTYGCDMLDILPANQINSSTSTRPFSITFPRFYKAKEAFYRLESFMRSIGKG